MRRLILVDRFRLDIVLAAPEPPIRIDFEVTDAESDPDLLASYNALRGVLGLQPTTDAAPPNLVTLVAAGVALDEIRLDEYDRALLAWIGRVVDRLGEVQLTVSFEAEPGVRATSPCEWTLGRLINSIGHSYVASDPLKATALVQVALHGGSVEIQGFSVHRPMGEVAANPRS